MLKEDQLPEALLPEEEDQSLSEETLEEDQLPEADEPPLPDQLPEEADPLDELTKDPEEELSEKEDPLLPDESLPELDTEIVIGSGCTVATGGRGVDTGTGIAVGIGEGIGVGRAVGIILAGPTTFGGFIGPPCTCPHQATSSRLARRKEVLIMCIARCPNSNEFINCHCRGANKFYIVYSLAKKKGQQPLKGQTSGNQEILSWCDSEHNSGIPRNAWVHPKSSFFRK